MTLAPDKTPPEFAIDRIPDRPFRWPWRRVVIVMLVVAGLGTALSVGLELAGIPPRLLAPYLQKRAEGHDPAIVDFGNWLATNLMRQDRGLAKPLQAGPGALTRFRIGAQRESTVFAVPPGGARVVPVGTPEAALAAFASAEPGDVITFLPGKYRFEANYIKIARPGTRDKPVVVRAAQPGTVTLAFSMVEGFLVSAPYWRFENLTIVGACDAHATCEHAFHIVGNAHHFVARNNTIVDFNSHFKINGQSDVMPDNGLLEANTLTNNSVRQTYNPVDVIDIVGASHWVIRKNFITDFFKGEGNRTSYGGFAKGGGSDNLFENNIVLCEYRIRNPGALTVGLSLGGGGTGAPYCRDKRCVTEQNAGIIRGNLIAACSNEGIYLNKAARSKVVHNTIIDTAGIAVRFPSSSADVEGNLIDGRIRVRNEAVVRATDNKDTSSTRLYLGSHPVRDLFDTPGNAIFNGAVPRRSAGAAASPVADLCGTPASGPHSYGAFDRFADCLR